MITKKAVLMILVLLTSYIGAESKYFKVEGGQVCKEKRLEKEPCSNELTQIEMEILRNIFESVLASGRAPTIQEMTTSLERSGEEVVRAIDGLESKDLLLRGENKQEIISVYPFSLTPTKHQLFLENEKKLFAMCAVDALGMPVMFNRNVKIVSQCEWCKQKISIEIEDGEIVSESHPDITIWSPEHQETPPAETCCPKVNFFCSKKHLEEWKNENPDLVKTGHSAQLEEAFPRIKESWKAYGKLIGVQ